MVVAVDIVAMFLDFEIVDYMVLCAYMFAKTVGRGLLPKQIQTGRYSMS